MALLLVSIQNVIQFKVKERTRGTLFFTAVLTSATSRNHYVIKEKKKNIYIIIIDEKKKKTLCQYELSGI